MLIILRVVELVEMFFYSVICGDIGINLDVVEKYFNFVLYFGKIWNCG